MALDAYADRENHPISSLQEGIIDELSEIEGHLYCLTNQKLVYKRTPNGLNISVVERRPCPACPTWYFPERKDQVYCSKRCGARLRNREAYRRKKADRSGS